jgi:NADH-quinone oxidoreductase subunit G
LSRADEGVGSSGIAAGLVDGSLTAALLLNVDPARDFGPALTDAIGDAEFVVTVSMFENSSTRHADVVLPGEAYAEKEGTVTHPDGRLQRLRPGVPHPGRVRPTWEVLVELSALLGEETGIDSAPEALAAIADEVPFYAGISHEEIGGLGVRWQERDAARNCPTAESAAGPSPETAERISPKRVSAKSAEADGGDGRDGLRLGTYRDLWAAEVTEKSRALRFLAPRQALELAPADAERLGVGTGEEVDVRSNGTSVRARVEVRERVRPGSGFLVDGLGDAAGTLRGEVAEVSRAGEAT